ncbi:hypothetical protein ACMFMG_009149 [Clarireedia jacksonii]
MSFALLAQLVPIRFGRTAKISISGLFCSSVALFIAANPIIPMYIHLGAAVSAWRLILSQEEDRTPLMAAPETASADQSKLYHVSRLASGIAVLLVTRYCLALTICSLFSQAGIPNTVRAGVSLAAVYSDIAHVFIGYAGSQGYGGIIIGNIMGSSGYILCLALGIDVQKVENINDVGFWGLGMVFLASMAVTVFVWQGRGTRLHGIVLFAIYLLFTFWGRWTEISGAISEV